jgi:monofunctional biosynthetic peptidoglycan transglycosylase
MEVYLNVAETGIGTYGVDAGARRYFGHDASNLSRTEAARIAAIFPLPKRREAIAPSGFTRRYGNMLAARMTAVARDRLDACVYSGRAAPAERPEPALRRQAPRPQPRPLPGEEFERQAPAPAPAPPPPPAEPKPDPAPETNGL